MYLWGLLLIDFHNGVAMARSMGVLSSLPLSPISNSHYPIPPFHFPLSIFPYPIPPIQFPLSNSPCTDLFLSQIRVESYFLRFLLLFIVCSFSISIFGYRFSIPRSLHTLGQFFQPSFFCHGFRRGFGRGFNSG